MASAIGILSGAFPEASLSETAVIPPLQFIVNLEVGCVPVYVLSVTEVTTRILHLTGGMLKTTLD